jgi:hypothetical protein
MQGAQKSCFNLISADVSSLKDRYKAFMRVMREWRHLKMLKCAGRGHAPLGVGGMAPGELCVLCPACPHPEMNLPDNWDTCSDDMKYVLARI